MSSIAWIVGGVATIGAVCYCYRRSKTRTKKDKETLVAEKCKELKPEQIDTLSLEDVVKYFKGLSLRQGKDVPFIANANKTHDLLNMAKDGPVSYFLATYNEETGEVENYRLLQPEKTDQKLTDLMGKEKLVVLS